MSTGVTSNNLSAPSSERGNSNDGSPTRGNSNDQSPTRGNSNDRSPTRTEVRSPTSTSTSTEVRSPTSTSTDAYTRGNVTVTGGAGNGAYTVVRVYQGAPDDFAEREGRAAGRTQEHIVRDNDYAGMAPRPRGLPIPLQPSTTQNVGFGAPHQGHGGGGGHHGGGGHWHGGGGRGRGYGYGYPVVQYVEPDVIYTQSDNPCTSPELFAHPKESCDMYALRMRQAKIRGLRGFGADVPATTPAVQSEADYHAGEWHIPGVPFYLDPLNLVQQTWAPHHPGTDIGAGFGIALARALSAVGAVGLGWYVHKKTKSVPKAAAGAVVGSAIGPLALSIWERNRG